MADTSYSGLVPPISSPLLRVRLILKFVVYMHMGFIECYLCQFNPGYIR